MAASILSRGLSRFFTDKLLYARPLCPVTSTVSSHRRFCSSSDSDDDRTSRVQLPRPAGKKKPGEKMRQFRREPSVISELKPELVSAASDAARSLEGDVQEITKDLLQQLQAHHRRSEAQKAGDTPPAPQGGSVGKMLSGMKMEHAGRRGARGRSRPAEMEDASQEHTPQAQGRGIMNSMINGPPGAARRFDGTGKQGPFSQRRSRGPKPVSPNLFEGPALGIFTPENFKPHTPATTEGSLFDAIDLEEMLHSGRFPPDNAFEEQVQWSRQGKLWHYPVDNEQGWEAEADVPFHEHIFLERHLMGFPDIAPISHFMELVVVGLSKNPYMSVQQKMEHIDWFRQYFEEKKPILKEYVKNAQVQNENPEITS